MPSNKYWEQRQVLDAFEVFQDAEAIADDIAKLYQKASGYLTHEAQEIFERFRRKYGLTEKEAYQLINSIQDSDDLDELLQKLKNVEQTEAIQEIRKQIESAAFQARLERLRQLQNELDLIMTTIYEQELQKNTAFYVDLANESYYRTIFNLQQRTGLGFSFSHIDRKVIDKVLGMNWSGRHYSRRIWGNVKTLAKTLKIELLVNLLVGRTEMELAEILRKKFGAAASAARRLVRTESNYVSTELNSMAYEEAGVEEYLYLATLDLRTSKICRGLDGKIFKVSERKVGTNCPPMHPWCRSTTIAVIDRELLKELERRARDPVTGKLITVPMTMTYPEWYEKYVKGHEKEIEEAQKEEAEKQTAETMNADRQQYERYRERGVGPETYEEFKKTKYNNPEEYAKLKLAYKDKSLQKRIRENYNLTVNPEKQARHMKDSDGYIEGRSYMTISEEEVQKLVDEHAGHGEVYRYHSGKYGKKELVILDRHVGVNIDLKTGIETSTNRIYIHYSTTGTHVVPTLKGVEEDA